VRCMDYPLAFNTSYLFAFAMGLFSSLHCIGMCGSIIGTLTLSLAPEIRNNKRTLFPFVLNYNLGRIISYSLAGAIVGILEFFLTLVRTIFRAKARFYFRFIINPPSEDRGN